MEKDSGINCPSYKVLECSYRSLNTGVNGLKHICLGDSTIIQPSWNLLIEMSLNNIILWDHCQTCCLKKCQLWMYYISKSCPFCLRWLEPSSHGTLNKRDPTTTCPHLETTTTVFRFLCHISSNSTTLEVNEDWSSYFCFFPIPVAEWTEQKYLVPKGRRKQKAQVSITK